jgi:large subunit ribosomal protein L18
MEKNDIKIKRRERRKLHIRKRIIGTADRPRMTVFRSLNNIYVQIVDDESGRTLISASTLDKGMKETVKPDMKKTDRSKIVGVEIAKKALEANIKKVSFDRNGYLYHGRVKALADAARENGLVF